jgi:Family of unknown function (DUF5681)
MKNTNNPVTEKGRFKKGSSGNPSGRPAGSRNQTTLIVEQLLEGEAENLTRKLVELAMKGNIQALRLCMDRLVPARKERPIELELKPVQNSHDLPVASSDVLTAVAEGRITAGEGSAVANIMSGHAKSVEADNLSRRVEELESHLDKIRNYPRQRDKILEGAAREP